MISDDKYVVFKREDFLRIIEDNGFRRASSLIDDEFHDAEIHDAVVIRRQDKFASPCLLTYAVMIAMVGENHPDAAVKEELLTISDYFHRQGVLAGDEGYKYPTL